MYPCAKTTNKAGGIEQNKKRTSLIPSIHEVYVYIIQIFLVAEKKVDNEKRGSKIDNKTRALFPSFALISHRVRSFLMYTGKCENAETRNIAYRRVW